MQQLCVKMAGHDRLGRRLSVNLAGQNTRRNPASHERPCVNSENGIEGCSTPQTTFMYGYLPTSGLMMHQVPATGGMVTHSAPQEQIVHHVPHGPRRHKPPPKEAQ